MMRSFMIFN